MDPNILKQCDLFQGLDDTRITRVGALAGRRQVTAGSQLFAIGTKAKVMYIVVSGRIQLTFPVHILGAEKSVVLEDCTANHVVAWSAMVPPHHLTLSGVCVEDADLLVLERDALLRLFDEDPVIGRVLMGNVAEVVGRRLQMIQAVWARGIQRTLQEKYR